MQLRTTQTIMRSDVVLKEATYFDTLISNVSESCTSLPTINKLNLRYTSNMLISHVSKTGFRLHTVFRICVFVQSNCFIWSQISELKHRGRASGIWSYSNHPQSSNFNSQPFAWCFPISFKRSTKSEHDNYFQHA